MPAIRLFGLCALLAIGCDGGVKLSIPGGKDLSKAGEAVTSQAGYGTGPIRVYFTKPDKSPSDPGNPAAILASYIGQAKQTIDVAAFELDNKVITDALVQAVRRNVRVRLVTETDYLRESGVLALQAVGVEVVDDRRDGALMHNKFMVFDERAVWTGSMNFTENCAYKNNNNGMYIESQQLAANYSTKFSWMFEKHRFGGLPEKTAKIPYPTITLADGTHIESYFSTHDHGAKHVQQAVEKATKRIHFMAFSFTHKGIGEAMVKLAQSNVEIKGVFEKSQTTGGYSYYNKLRDAYKSIEVYVDANPRNMHHKVILIDDQTTIAGSFNFSESADKQNDENLLIIHSWPITRQFEDEFQRVFGAAREADGKSIIAGRKR